MELSDLTPERQKERSKVNVNEQQQGGEDNDNKGIGDKNLKPKFFCLPNMQRFVGILSFLIKSWTYEIFN